MGYIKCFDSGDDAMRMSELKRREVINVCDCKRLGFVVIWMSIRVQAGFWRSSCRDRAVSAVSWDGKKNL